MTGDSAITEALLERARQGDRRAVDELLHRHRKRLKRMISVRFDPALAARTDPSDVVQDTLVIAANRIGSYLQESSLPFYPWLRSIAIDKLIELRRHHRTERRNVLREEPFEGEINDQSALELAECLVTSATSPSGQLLRDELRNRVRLALAQLAPADREVLVLRYIEQMKVAEIASVLGIAPRAAHMRHARALERLRDFLDSGLAEDHP